MGTIAIYALLIAHITAYKERYMEMGIIFCCSYAFKRVLRAGGNKDQADLTGLGGYVLTFGAFINLIREMKKGSFAGKPGATTEIMGGLLGNVLSGGADFLKNIGK